MNAIPCLTIQDVANLDGVLGDFLQKAEAELTVVIDRGGNVISQFGDMTVMDVTIIAALAAGIVTTFSANSAFPFHWPSSLISAPPSVTPLVAAMSPFGPVSRNIFGLYL